MARASTAACTPFQNAVVALVLGDGDAPQWVPVGMFDFGVATAPAHWEFQV